MRRDLNRKSIYLLYYIDIEEGHTQLPLFHRVFLFYCWGAGAIVKKWQGFHGMRNDNDNEIEDKYGNLRTFKD